MFSSFTDKVKGAFGVKFANADQVAEYNASTDHDGDSAATISATSNAWAKAIDVKDGIGQYIGSHFGSIVYCIKDTEGKEVSNTWNDIKADADAALKASKDILLVDLDVESFIGSGFEAATDEFVSIKIHDTVGSRFSEDVTTNTWNDIENETDAALEATEDLSLVDLDVESFVGSGFEASTDEFVSVASVKQSITKTLDAISSCQKTVEEQVQSNDLVSSGHDDMKFVIKGGFKGVLGDAGNVSMFGKIGNIRHFLAQGNKELERTSPDVDVRTK